MAVSHTHHDTLHKTAQDKSPGTVLLHLVVTLKYLFLRAQKIAVLESTDEQGQGEWQPGLPGSGRLSQAPGWLSADRGGKSYTKSPERPGQLGKHS